MARLSISFVIPSYNQGPFLRACLDSILSQNLNASEYEVIVIDGGSTDGSVQIIASHPVVTYWVSEQDLGHWDGVNKGIQRSRGELIAWINSDDFYQPDCFHELLSYIDAHPDADIYYGDADEVDGDGQFLRPYPVEDWNYGRMMDRCILSQPATIIRRSVFERFGLLSGECRVALDLEYWLRVGMCAQFIRVPLKIACSRLWGETKSSTQQLSMQEDALYYGHKYGSRWSRRRLESAAECRMLKQFPRLSADVVGFSFLMFHLLRTVFISQLYLQCQLGLFDPRSKVHYD